jgi:transcription elongation factor GreB
VVEVVAWAAGNGDRSENGDYIYGKKRLREIDRRLRFLTKRIESAEVVDPARQSNHDRVFFGATVTYVDAEADLDAPETTLRIVGIDEADTARGEVSWVSPIARALMKAEAAPGASKWWGSPTRRREGKSDARSYRANFVVLEFRVGSGCFPEVN